MFVRCLWFEVDGDPSVLHAAAAQRVDPDLFYFAPACC